MFSALRDQFLFFRQFRERFETTGAILPSSRFLARKMTRPLAACEGGRRVLEVGPGTGAVTSQIVRELRPNDQFDLVEINEQFADLLRKRFEEDRAYQPAAAISRVHTCPLQEYSGGDQYDVVISGLPFNNFPAALVESLVDRCLALLRPGGTFHFLSTCTSGQSGSACPGETSGARLQSIEAFMQQRFQSMRVRRDWIFLNVPPAWVQHLRKPGG